MTEAKSDQLTRRFCNRHHDCDAAEQEILAKNLGMKIWAGFHCNDDECEECFGN